MISFTLDKGEEGMHKIRLIVVTPPNSVRSHVIKLTRENGLEVGGEGGGRNRGEVAIQNLL